MPAELAFRKFFQLCKVDEAARTVYGLVTFEKKDQDGETCHYDSTKPQYKAVNDAMAKMSAGDNIMPLREMHQLIAAGAGKTIDFNDEAKEIRMGFYVSDDSTWKKVMDKVLLGFSQGGKYLKRWTENGINYYTALPGEVSLVDNPCLPGAVIEYAKADGASEKYEVPLDPVSELNTKIEKLSADMDALVRKFTADGSDQTMNKEQIVKCAAALGISVEEFEKQYVVGEKIAKAHSMAALHASIEKAHGHHEDMIAHHEKMGKMHAAHAAMLGKCMKAAKGLMGSEEDAEKALKALKDELALVEKKDEPAVGLKAEDVTKAIEDALAKQKKEFDEKLEKMLAPKNGGTGNARLVLIGRDGKEVEKAVTSNGVINPMAVND